MLGRVALARAELHDPRIAAGPVGEARRHVREQLVHDVASSGAWRWRVARSEVAALAERDHLLGERLHRLRLRLGRLDPAVLDQRAGEVRVEGSPMGGIPPELLPAR
jgi:hypothetical protein